MPRSQRAFLVLASAALVPLLLLAGFVGGRPLRFALTASDAPHLEGFLFNEGPAAQPRWARSIALVEAPVVVRGPARLVLTASRPEREPRTVTALQNGVERARFEVGAVSTPFAVPLDAQSTLAVSLVALGPEPRYGLRVESVALERDAALAVVPDEGVMWRACALGAVIGLGLALGGVAPVPSLVLVGALVALPLGVLAFFDPLGALRLVQHGGVAIGVVAGLSVLGAGRLAPAAPVLAAAALLAGVLVRGGLVFHPRYAYQDVDIHERMVRAVQREGTGAVWSDIRLFQQRYDLGRARVGQRFRPFPYPPMFHTLVAAASPSALEDAMKAFGLACGAAAILLAMALARRLGGAGTTAAVTALLAALFPSDVLEMLRASYPAMLGHVVDAALLLALLTAWPFRKTAPGALWLALALGAAALTYNASPVHFAVFLPLLVLAARVPPPLPVAGVIAGALGGALISMSFYGRYVLETVQRLGVSAAGAVGEVRAWTARGVLDEIGGLTALVGLVALARLVRARWPEPSARVLAAALAYVPVITIVVLLFPDTFFYFRTYYLVQPLLLAGAGAVAAEASPRVRYALAAGLVVWSLVTLLSYVDPFFVSYTGTVP